MRPLARLLSTLNAEMYIIPISTLEFPINHKSRPPVELFMCNDVDVSHLMRECWQLMKNLLIARLSAYAGIKFSHYFVSNESCSKVSL